MLELDFLTPQQTKPTTEPTRRRRPIANFRFAFRLNVPASSIFVVVIGISALDPALASFFGMLFWTAF